MKKTERKECADKALHAAECEYLKASGWKKKANEKSLKWIAPIYPGFRHWDGVFKGDVLLHDRAVQTQKSFEAESKHFSEAR